MQSLLLAIIIVVALALIFTNRLRADLVAILVMLVLAFAGLITFEDALDGFSNSAVITILAMFIVSRGLEETGIIAWIGEQIRRASRGRERWLVLITMIAGMIMVQFMNIVAAGAVLMPAVLNAARDSRVRPSKVLIPLSYGTLLGATATIFISANVIVSNQLEISGYEALKLTDFLKTGTPIVLMGLLYMALIGIRLLPDRASIRQIISPNSVVQELSEAYHLSERLWRARVSRQSSLAGVSLIDSHIGERHGVTVLLIEQPDKTIAAPDPTCPINGGDTLVILGREDRVMQLAEHGLTITQVAAPDDPSRTLDLTEIAVLPRATVTGKSLVELRFRAQYGLSAIALLREGQVLRTDVGTRPLKAGDALLVMGPPSKIQSFSKAQDEFMIVEGSHAIRPALPHKARTALVILMLMIAGVILDLMPTAFAALAAAVAMIATRCLNLETAYQSVELRVIFLIAGMSSISIALMRTDLAAQIGGFVVDAAGPFGSFAVLGVAFLITMAITQLVTGQVAALIMAPIVVSIAVQTGIDPRAMGIVAATACSTAFLTPLAHPVNVLMMGPGGYRSSDFFRVGLGLTIVVFVTLMIGMAVWWSGSL